MKKLFCIFIITFFLSGQSFSQITLQPWHNPQVSNDKVQTEQVRIQARILEWSLDNSSEYGFSAYFAKNLENGAIVEKSDLTLPMESNLEMGGRLFFDKLLNKYGNLEIALEALEQQGKVRVLCEPNITISKDAATPAKIQTGSKVPYEATQIVNDSIATITKFREIGITLEVKVLDILYERYVKLSMEANVSGLTGFVSVALDQYGNPLQVPELSTRTIKNTLILPDKETFVTGILKTQSTLTTNQGVPFFINLPVIKHLFKNYYRRSSDTELIFIITPEILNLQTEEMN